MLHKEVDGQEPVLKQRATVPPETRNPKPETGSASAFLALHFNHRLRGAAADADERFCRELCSALGVRLVVGAATWPAGSEVSEAEARDARFSFFQDAMAEAGARALWLGHHQDDVVETMLLRLSRGSGSRGLAAPRPVQRMADGTVRLRPLLDVAKAEIVAALRTAGVLWCEDETNHGDAYFRNRLRRQVVPAWAAVAPADLAEAVARSRALLEEEDEALELWADRVLPRELGEGLPLAALREAPVAVTRRALHRWLMALGDGHRIAGGLSEPPHPIESPRLGRAAFEELLAAVRAGREAKLSAGEAGFLVVGGDALRIEAVETAAPGWSGGALAVPGESGLPGGAKLRTAIRSLDAELRGRICAGEFDDGRTAFFAAMETSGGLSIRSWRPGDRYVPLGDGQSTKLQDQFVNRRIPRQLRQRLPVVCAADGAILWVPGLPPAQRARITDGTMEAVQLTYLPADSLSDPRHV
jgi:tRNA(Ile)-lysidine synthase